LGEYVLDAFAVLALVQAGPGGPRVREILADADNTCHLSILNLGEVVYAIHRRRGIAAAEQTEAGVVQEPSVLLAGVDLARVRAAAAIKARGRMSYADAFAAALAMELDAPLVTGDPEFARLEQAGEIRVEWLARGGSSA